MRNVFSCIGRAGWVEATISKLYENLSKYQCIAERLRQPLILSVESTISRGILSVDKDGITERWRQQHSIILVLVAKERGKSLYDRDWRPKIYF